MNRWLNRITKTNLFRFIWVSAREGVGGGGNMEYSYNELCYAYPNFLQIHCVIQQNKLCHELWYVVHTVSVRIQPIIRIVLMSGQ